LKELPFGFVVVFIYFITTLDWKHLTIFLRGHNGFPSKAFQFTIRRSAKAGDRPRGMDEQDPMQRQVDADDEAEQRKLEEEIAASRIARMRRSRGAGYGNKTSSLDLGRCSV